MQLWSKITLPRRIPDAPMMHPWCNRMVKIGDRRSKSEIQNKIHDQKIINHKSKIHNMGIFHIWRNLQVQKLRESSPRLDSNQTLTRPSLYLHPTTKIETESLFEKISIRKSNTVTEHRLYSKKSLFAKSLSLYSQIPNPQISKQNVQRPISNSWRQRSSRLHDVCRQIANFTTPGSSHPLKWN